MSELPQVPTISVAYQCTPAEFRMGQAMLVSPEQQTANAAAKPGKNGQPPKPRPAGQLKFGRGLFGWLLFVGLAIMFFMLMRQKHPQAVAPRDLHPWEGLSQLPGFYILLTGAAVFVAGIVLIRIASRSFQKRRTADTTYEISDVGITIITPFQTSRWAWSRFHSFGRNESVIILRTSPRIGLILPVRLFTGGQLDQLTAFLTQRLAVKAPTLHGGFEVVPT